jgi:hypothetical protein
MRKEKQIEPAAPRRTDFETMLCQAISRRETVTLRYKNDVAERTFDPYAVYFSSTDKVCVAGNQVLNPAKPLERNEPHNLEVGKITSLTLGGPHFTVDNRFNRHDEKYAKGIICSV